MKPPTLFTADIQIMKPLPDTPLTRRALEIATAAHAGQMRYGYTKDKDVPYITHPVAVAGIAIELLDERFRLGYIPAYRATDRARELITVICYLHDVREDHPTYPLAARLYELRDAALLTDEERSEIDGALFQLDRTRYDGYLPYILGVKQGTCFVTIPKSADLRHNMGDSCPRSRADKYALALHILETN